MKAQELDNSNFRIAFVKLVKRCLHRFHFRGKGSILLALCPKKGVQKISLFGFDFDCDLSDHIQRFIFLFDYDSEAVGFVKKNIKSGDTFVDVGANVGFYSLLASSLVGETGKVIAIEPNPRTFAKMKATLEKNRIENVLLLNVGVGNQKGNLDLFFDTSTGNDSATMVGCGSRQSVKVPVLPLDDILSEQGVSSCEHLKIDVDGFEPKVFAGCKKLFENGQVKVIQSEFCDYWLRQAGSSPQQLHDTLTSSGFEDVHGVPTFRDGCIVDRFFVRRSTGKQGAPVIAKI